MHRAVLAAVALLAFGAALVAAAPVRAADFGAVAYDGKTGNAGWSIREPNPKRAEEVALHNCHGDCKIVVRIAPHHCAALARAGDGKHVGAAARPERDEARRAALGDCEKGSHGQCVIRFTECNR
jgi:Domain of unknown function (DUF4189)